MSEAILQVTNLKKDYGKINALSDVSFEVRPREIVGLLGHNGSGKSTLIKCLMGVIKSYKGTIAIAGHDIRRKHHAISDNAGFLLEPSFNDYLSARTNLELLCAASSLEKAAAQIEYVLSLVSLKSFADKKVGDFSFGMRQRLGLAQVLLTQPKLIVLDEPTVGLDPLGVEIIKNVLVECKSKGVATLFSSHQLNDVLDICDRAVVMNHGSVVYDGAASEFNQKCYVIYLACDAKEHEQNLKELVPEIKVDCNVIRFESSDSIDTVFRYLVSNDLPVKNLDFEICRSDLRQLMI